MPATFCHVAAVLPFRRARSLPFTALALGAMGPDLPYFLPAAVPRWPWAATHSFVGSVVIVLPTALAAFLLVTFVREDLPILLPREQRLQATRAESEYRWTKPGIAFAALAILLGAWTHILWDHWTHATGFFVRRIPLMRTALALGPFAVVPIYEILQHLSSFVGGLALVQAWRQAYRRAGGGAFLASLIDARWLAFMVGTVGLSLLYGLACANDARAGDGWAFDVLTSAGRGWFVLAALKICWHRAGRARGAPTADSVLKTAEVFSAAAKRSNR